MNMLFVNSLVQKYFMSTGELSFKLINSRVVSTRESSRVGEISTRAPPWSLVDMMDFGIYQISSRLEAGADFSRQRAGGF